jgi:subtilisin family serine protease
MPRSRGAGWARVHRGTWLVVAAALTLDAPAAFAQSGNSYAPGEILLKFRPGTSQHQRELVLADLGATRIAGLRSIGASHERVTRYTVEAAVARYRSDARIEFIEPNYVVRALEVPDDPEFGSLWGLQNLGQTGGTPGADIRATQAWDIYTGGNVLVAIIDTGVDYNHPDLAANVWVNPGEIPGNGVDDDGNGFVDDVRGWDFAYDDNNPIDDYGHGTHVAGTVGAVGDNAVGVVGVNWSVRILPIKFLDASGSGTHADAIAAIEYATLMGARVMSNSWGGGPYSDAMYQAIASANSAGIVFVAAAGNSSSDNDVNPMYPAGYDLPNVVAVAATDANDQLAWFSSYGDNTVDLGAPGVDIVSTFPGGGYYSASGTSMACPHVSGAIALICGRFAGIAGNDAIGLLLANTDPVPQLAGKVITGGRLDAFLPIAEPDSIPPDPVTDLTVTRRDGNWIELSWTATGDDGSTGLGARYDLRYSSAAISETNFASASRAGGEPDPRASGSTELGRVNGLAFSTAYHFALKVLDEFGNASAISNPASGATLAPPDIAVAPESLSADLLTGQTATRTLTISNTGVSELQFDLSARPVEPAGGRPLARMAKASAGPHAPPAHPSPSAPRAYNAARAPMRPALLAQRIGPRAAVAGDLRILLLQSGGDVSEIHDRLAAFPDVASVDVFEGSAATPSLTELLAYHAVIAIANTPFGNPAGVGDVLADYVDDGGGVILTLATFIHGWAITGRFLSGGYSPFLLGGGPDGFSQLGVFDSSHPIMRGVVSAAGDLLGVNDLAPGADLVASWANGLPCVATRSRHVVAVNVFVGASGYYAGDVPLMLHNAAAFAGLPNFLAIEPRVGAVPPGGSMDVVVTFDAAELDGGDYRADVLVASNDPDEPQVIVPAHLHVTGAADIALSDDHFDFGATYVGASRRDTLVVSNDGTDDLTITSITASPGYAADVSGPFVLDPRHGQRVIVTFTPEAPGPLGGTLTIESDDPDEPSLAVTMHGEGVPPPDIVVTPASLDVGLFTGESTTRSVVIENTGTTALAFSLLRRSLSGSGGGAGARSQQLGSETTTATGARPIPVDASRAAPDGAASLAATRSSTRAAAVAGAPPPSLLSGERTLVLATIPVNGSVLRALQELGQPYDFMYRDDFTGIDFGPYDVILAAIDGGYVSSASVQALAGAAAAGKLLVMLGGTSYLSYYEGVQAFLLSHSGQTGWDICEPPHLTVTDATHPLAQDLPASVTYADVYASFYMLRIQDPAATAPVRNGAGHPALVHKAIGAGSLVYFINSPYEDFWSAPADFAILKQVVRNALRFAGPAWLSVAPQQGTVAPGAQVALEVGFDATGLLGGDYLATIAITSNDPDESPFDVPVTLHVTGAPDIAATPDTVDFDSLFVGATGVGSIMVTNQGTDLLTVAEVATTHADFSAPAQGFGLQPGQGRLIEVTFTPSTAATIEGALRITSDDPDQPALDVPLRGTGLVPPDIGVTPSLVDASLYSGDMTTRPIHVANDGGSNLRVSVSVSMAAPGASPPAWAAVAARSRESRQGGADQPRPRGPSGLAPLLHRRLALMPASAIAFHDDMEGGDNGWTRVVLAPDDLWHRTTRAFSSPVTSWWCGNEGAGHYGTGNRIATAAVSPPIDLGHVRAPIELTFHEIFDTEYGWDFCMVDVSTDAGATWTPLRGERGSAPSGSSGGWVQTQLDVSAYEGAVIRLRFYFDTIDAIANDYPGWFFDDVTVSASGMSWLSVAPSAATVPPGAGIDLEAMFDAAGLPGGDYFGEVRITSNDPDEPVTSVAAALHVTGAPDIAAAPAALDFDSLFVGATTEDTLLVTNPGTDSLIVTMVEVINPAFTAAGAGFTMAAGQSRMLQVGFAPTSPGAHQGAVVFHCNDPDEPDFSVPLAGFGVPAPEVSVSPSLFQEVLRVGDTSTQPLEIVNDGPGTLDWTLDVTYGVAGAVVAHEPAAVSATPTAPDKRIATTPPAPPDAARVHRRSDPPADGARANGARGAAGAGDAAGARDGAGASAASDTPGIPSLEAVLSTLDIRHGSISGLIPSRYDFNEGVSGSSIADGGDDMYDGGNFLGTPMGGPLPYTNGVISSDPALGPSGRYFTRKYTGLFVAVMDLDGVGSFRIEGDLGADGYGMVDGGVLELNFGGLLYRGYTKRVSGAGDPSVNHLFLIPEASATAHTYVLDSNSDFDEVGGMGKRLYYLLFAGAGGAYIDDQAMLDITQAFVLALQPGPPWLTVGRQRGSIIGAGTASVDVNFDARELPAGEYRAALRLATNDPDEASTILPVTLEVVAPTAIELALVSASAEPGRARLTWHAAGKMAGGRATVERREAASDWLPRGEIAADGEGYLRYEDLEVRAGQRYGYRLVVQDGETSRTVGEAWVEVPVTVEFALAGPRPHPARGELAVAFSLPDARRATLELLDLAGRRVRAIEVGERGAGRHLVTLGRTERLPAGLYLIRLLRDGRALTARCVIVK